MSEKADEIHGVDEAPVVGVDERPLWDRAMHDPEALQKQFAERGLECNVEQINRAEQRCTLVIPPGAYHVAFGFEKYDTQDERRYYGNNPKRRNEPIFLDDNGGRFTSLLSKLRDKLVIRHNGKNHNGPKKIEWVWKPNELTMESLQTLVEALESLMKKNLKSISADEDIEKLTDIIEKKETVCAGKTLVAGMLLQRLFETTWIPKSQKLSEEQASNVRDTTKFFLQLNKKTGRVGRLPYPQKDASIDNDPVPSQWRIEEISGTNHRLKEKRPHDISHSWMRISNGRFVALYDPQYHRVRYYDLQNLHIEPDDPFADFEVDAGGLAQLHNTIGFDAYRGVRTVKTARPEGKELYVDRAKAHMAQILGRYEADFQTPGGTIELINGAVERSLIENSRTSARLLDPLIDIERLDERATTDQVLNQLLEERKKNIPSEGSRVLLYLEAHRFAWAAESLQSFIRKELDDKQCLEAFSTAVRELSDSIRPLLEHLIKPIGIKQLKDERLDLSNMLAQIPLDKWYVQELRQLIGSIPPPPKDSRAAPTPEQLQHQRAVASFYNLYQTDKKVLDGIIGDVESGAIQTRQELEQSLRDIMSLAREITLPAPQKTSTSPAEQAPPVAIETTEQTNTAHTQLMHMYNDWLKRPEVREDAQEELSLQDHLRRHAEIADRLKEIIDALKTSGGTLENALEKLEDLNDLRKSVLRIQRRYFSEDELNRTRTIWQNASARPLSDRYETAWKHVVNVSGEQPPEYAGLMYRTFTADGLLLEPLIADLKNGAIKSLEDLKITLDEIWYDCKDIIMRRTNSLERMLIRGNPFDDAKAAQVIEFLKGRAEEHGSLYDHFIGRGGYKREQNGLPTTIEEWEHDPRTKEWMAGVIRVLLAHEHEPGKEEIELPQADGSVKKKDLSIGPWGSTDADWLYYANNYWSKALKRWTPAGRESITYRVYLNPDNDAVIPCFEAMIDELDKDPVLQEVGFDTKTTNVYHAMDSSRWNKFNKKDRMLIYAGQRGMQRVVTILAHYLKKHPRDFQRDGIPFAQPIVDDTGRIYPGAVMSTNPEGWYINKYGDKISHSTFNDLQGQIVERCMSRIVQRASTMDTVAELCSDSPTMLRRFLALQQQKDHPSYLDPMLEDEEGQRFLRKQLVAVYPTVAAEFHMSEHNIAFKDYQVEGRAPRAEEANKPRGDWF